MAWLCSSSGKRWPEGCLECDWCRTWPPRRMWYSLVPAADRQGRAEGTDTASRPAGASGVCDCNWRRVAVALAPMWLPLWLPLCQRQPAGPTWCRCTVCYNRDAASQPAWPPRRARAGKQHVHRLPAGLGKQTRTARETKHKRRNNSHSSRNNAQAAQQCTAEPSEKAPQSKEQIIQQRNPAATKLKHGPDKAAGHHISQRWFVCALKLTELAKPVQIIMMPGLQTPVL